MCFFVAANSGRTISARHRVTNAGAGGRLSSAPASTTNIPAKGTIKLWDARAEAIFGLRAAHWRGYRQAITLGHAKTGGQVLATRATHKLGSKLYVELLGSSETRQQNTLGAVATGRAITQRYLAERAQRARIRLSTGQLFAISQDTGNMPEPGKTPKAQGLIRHWREDFFI